MGRAFRKHEGIFWIRAKNVLARLEPEQSGQRQPFLLKIFDQFVFPLVERLLVGGIDEDGVVCRPQDATPPRNKTAASSAANFIVYFPVLLNIGQWLQAPPFENLLEFVDQRRDAAAHSTPGFRGC